MQGLVWLLPALDRSEDQGAAVQAFRIDAAVAEPMLTALFALSFVLPIPLFRPNHRERPNERAWQ